MPYTILWNKIAIDSLRKLEKNISERIVIKVRSLVENPYFFLERLSGEKLYKVRVGDYRIVVEMDEANKKIFIRLAGHRKNVYKILGRIL